MKLSINKIFEEMIKDEVPKNESLADFYKRFKETSNNPDFLENNFRNPNFEMRMVGDGGIKSIGYCDALSNKCETNTFSYIKQMVSKDIHHYFPVSGWAFMESTGYFEHFWVYDEINNLFLEISPLKGDLPIAYGGVINKDINEEIVNAENFNEIKFLLGKHHSSLYANYEDKESNPKLEPYKDKTIEGKLFNYIRSNSNYSDLAQFIDMFGVDTLQDLKILPYKLEDLQSKVRNNREYDRYGKVIDQINNLLKQLNNQ